MKLISTILEFRHEINRRERQLGLVPTMGSLHEGHMALVRRACIETTTVAVSIFVNPTQFGPHEDLAAYPHEIDSDLIKLESAGVELVFTPSTEEMYPTGFNTHVDVGHIAQRQEGKSRVEHFRGVATVVCKLLAIVRPDKAYFGQKDAQQLAVVRRLNTDLNLGAEIVVVPTIRENNGLALSSRNAYLSQEERDAATILYRSLCLAQDLREQGSLDATEIKQQMCDLINEEPLAKIDYVSIADSTTLEELDTISGSVLVSLAVRIGKARLIDNITLGE